MESINHIYKILGIVSMVLFPVAWFIRLEAKVMYQDREIKRIEEDQKNHRAIIRTTEKEMWKKIETLQDSTNQVLYALARIEESIKYLKEK